MTSMPSPTMGGARRAFALFCLSAVAVATCLATPRQDGPTREPILRLETGMHTARINDIALDPAGRFLVTASDDKTARIWELPSGNLLRVLRVPVGAGNEGLLYS